MINSIDEEITNSFNGEKEKVGAYVNNIVNGIKDNDEAQKALVNLFTLDTSNMSVDDIQSEIDDYIKTIATAIGEEDVVALKIRLGFDDTDTQNLINNVKAKLKGTEFDDKVGELSLGDLQIASELEVPLNSIESWEELLTLIQKVKDEPTDLWDYSETITQLDTIKDKFDTLDKTYSKLFDSDKQIGIEDYSSINEAFKDVADIESYIQRLQEAGQNQEEVTAVMEDLISAYLDYTGLLDNVTEENASLIEQTLTELGVLNSKELVLARLSGELINMSNAEEIATAHGLTLTDVTWEEINALVAEGSIFHQKERASMYTFLQNYQDPFQFSYYTICKNLLHHLLHHFGVKMRETITTYVKLLAVPKSAETL